VRSYPRYAGFLAELDHRGTQSVPGKGLARCRATDADEQFIDSRYIPAGLAPGLYPLCGLFTEKGDFFIATFADHDRYIDHRIIDFDPKMNIVKR
jgi:hypothetical protein